VGATQKTRNGPAPQKWPSGLVGVVVGRSSRVRFSVSVTMPGGRGGPLKRLLRRSRPFPSRKKPRAKGRGKYKAASGKIAKKGATCRLSPLAGWTEPRSWRKRSGRLLHTRFFLFFGGLIGQQDRNVVVQVLSDVKKEEPMQKRQHRSAAGKGL